MTLDGLFAVTGAGSGIGRGVAHRISAAGGRVAVLDANVDAAKTVADELGGEAYPLDVSDADAVADVFGRLPALQGLVNCAGISEVTPIISTTPEQWRRMVSVHLDGTFFCLQAAARNLLRHGTRGTIVNTSSVNATYGHRGLAAYSAAKAGISMLTRVAALELAQPGIRVNAVAPGIVRTGMTEEVLQDPEAARTWSSSVPLGRIAEPEDIADIVVFLCGDGSRWLTGQILAADGGGSLRVEAKIFPDEAWTSAALVEQL